MAEVPGGGFDGQAPMGPRPGLDHVPQDIAAQAIAELQGTLEQSITTEVVSRLLLAHRSPSELIEPAPADRITPEHRDAFEAYILAGDLEKANHIISELHSGGVDDALILKELLGGAASRLGPLWEQDSITFSDVTLGLCTLHQVLRERRWLSSEVDRPTGSGLSALFTTLDGEQHIFGPMIVAEVFRRAGWTVVTMAGAKRADVAAKLAEAPFDILAVSATCIGNPDIAAEEIAHYRSASRDRALKVIVGGQAFSNCASLKDQIGADALILDVDSAPGLAAGLRQLTKASN